MTHVTRTHSLAHRPRDPQGLLRTAHAIPKAYTLASAAGQHGSTAARQHDGSRQLRLCRRWRPPCTRCPVATRRHARRPKSVIQVRNDLSFLDLTVMQIEVPTLANPVFLWPPTHGRKLVSRWAAPLLSVYISMPRAG